MKKSVAAIVLLAVIAMILLVSNGYNSYTGLQVIDLPAPPAPPGMEADQVLPPVQAPPGAIPPSQVIPGTTDAEDILSEAREGAAVAERVQAIEQKLKAVDLLPAWEKRLNNVEARVGVASNVPERVDALQSQVDSLRVDVDNLKVQAGKPYVEAPAFFDELQNLGRKNTVLSITLFIVVMFIAITLITMTIIQRRKEDAHNRQLIRQYLANYQKAGYRLDTLRMHLKACGWDDRFIDESVRELPR